jgi:hypothetical protein
MTVATPWNLEFHLSWILNSLLCMNIVISPYFQTSKILLEQRLSHTSAGASPFE